MQFRTILVPRSGSEQYLGRTDGPWEHFRFGYGLRDAPVSEDLVVQFGDHLFDTCREELWPNISTGAAAGLGDLRSAGVRLCSIELQIWFGQHHGTATAAQSIQNAIRWFVGDVIRAWSAPYDPLRKDWLTSDVVALARGIHANSAFDGLPALHDALLEAGCDDPLVMEHLRTCPDHAPSCWVVEMILATNDSSR